MGQPDRAHLFFPCNDHQSDQARFTFRITVPDGLTAVANGTLAGRSSAGGRTTFVYRTAHTMPTDVVQIAVGRFAVLNGRMAGGLTLFALRQQIGPVPFRKVEQAFYDRYRGRGAPTRDYLDTVNRVTGQNLTGFLNAWLYGPTTPPMPGHPEWKSGPVG